jgi:two-component system NtrC family response regulator
MAKVLIIDDDPTICSMLSTLVRRRGYQAICAETLHEGVQRVVSEEFDLVFLDVRLPDGNGIDGVSFIQSAPCRPEIIIMTGHGDPEGAESAIRSGVWDYIQKPSSIKQMMLPLASALEYRQKKLLNPAAVSLKREGIVGSSKILNVALDQLAKAAGSGAGVLITGETGTGKELFAHAVHRNSPRAGQNFVVLDCAALPETLVESILFGHERGAFTGADRARDGLVKQADRGTLFLDEIAEMPATTQKSFLRVLETHRFRPIGSKKEVHSDFRLVTSTNRDLDQMVRRGLFRSDLLFRIRTFSIELPPLREREEDIRELAVYHLNRICNGYGAEPKGFSSDFFDVLHSYDWPGNIREMVHALEIAFAEARFEPVLFARHLPTELRVKLAKNSIGNIQPAKRSAISESVLPTLQQVRESAVAESEQQYLQDLLAYTRGRIREACSISGLGRSRLYDLLKKYRLPGQRGEGFFPTGTP